jgi:hypothetical protein
VIFEVYFNSSTLLSSPSLTHSLTQQPKVPKVTFNMMQPIAQARKPGKEYVHVGHAKRGKNGDTKKNVI